MTGRTAHPRSHGENEALAASDATDKGSSPLTRGKHVAGVRRGAGGRLIPAHAGKTSTASRALVGVSAHPRSRGENASAASSFCSFAGSSPLTRGKRRHARAHVDQSRLIPAHAGKTSAASLSQSQPPGSSPLTRGKHLIKKKGTTIWRLSPAHAGKTHSVTKGPRSSAAHPRSRGENHPFDESRG